MSKKINKKQEIFESTQDTIINQHIGRTIEENQRAYSDLVITGRAIPSMYDGLKPVHRRIFYTFLNSNYVGKNVKSARITGETLGKFHPHGDLAVYGTLVEMTQVFKNRFPLTQGQGNWGNIQGDSEGAQRYCLTGDMKVITSNGTKSIEELINSKENEELDIDEIIYSLGKKENKAIKFFNSGKHDIYNLETEDGYQLRGSLNHPILTIQKDINGKPFYMWKMLSNLIKDEYVVIDRDNKKEILKEIKIKEKDVDKAIIFGCLISEGSISEKRISFNNTDKKYFDDFIKAWNKVFNNKYYINERILPSGKTIYEFDLQKNKENSFVFEDESLKEIISFKSEQKFIPKFIFEHNLEIKKVFLQYLFEGDGSFSNVSGDKRGLMLSYSSISNKLIKDVQLLLLEFGVYSKITNYNRKDNCNEYKLIINSFENQYIFKEEISFISEKKELFELKINELKEYFDNLKSVLSHSGDKIPYISDYIKSQKKISSNIKKMNIDRKEKIKRNYKKLSEELIKNNRIDLLDFYDEIISNNFYYTKVKSINKEKNKEIVYSIRVDSDCHSFSGNGFFNHNTEVKLPNDSANLLFDNINKDNVVTWMPNFDDTLLEPELLPVKYPVALLNGTSGIAYGGVTTKIPSYNIQEMTNLYIYLIENKFWNGEFKTSEHKEKIMEIIPGVDLPTGTNIYLDENNFQEDMIFKSDFTFRMRASYKINEKENTIVFTNIPIDTNTTRIVEEIKDAGLSYKVDKQTKKHIPKKDDFEILHIKENADVQPISSFNDDDYKNDAEITVSFKKGVDLNVELVKLFKYTSLDSSFAARMRFIDENSCPISLSLYEQTKKFLMFRLHAFYNSYLFDIDKLEKQLHLLYGIKIVLTDIKRFVEIVQDSEDETLVDAIKGEFDLDDIQIEYLLSMPLRKVSKTSVNKIDNEIEDKESNLIELKDKISTKEKLFNEIKKDYENNLTKQFISGKKNNRISSIIEAKKDISKADLIKDKEVILMYMEDDTIGFVDKDKYRAKNRGTQTSNNNMNDDFDLNLKLTETLWLKDDVMLMTDRGRVFKIPTYEFSNDFRFIGNTINLDKEENIISILKYSDDVEYYSILTKDGKIKGLHKSLLKNITQNRAITTISLENNDKVASFMGYNKLENEMIIIVTSEGKVLKYNTNDIKVLQSGNTKGVRAIKLSGDEIVLKGMIFVENEETTIIAVSDLGKGKKTFTKNIKEKKRGQSSNLFFNNSKENGEMIGSEIIIDSEKEGLLIMTEKANISIIKVGNFNTVSKNAKGSVNLINLNNEKIKISKKININEENSENEEEQFDIE